MHQFSATLNYISYSGTMGYLTRVHTTFYNIHEYYVTSQGRDTDSEIKSDLYCNMTMLRDFTFTYTIVSSVIRRHFNKQGVLLVGVALFIIIYRFLGRALLLLI